MLVPSDDPPFVTVRFSDSDKDVRLRARDGRELVRRLEKRAECGDLLARLFAARRASFPQQFVPQGDDEDALRVALDDPPELSAGRLWELRDTLRRRPGA